MSNPTPSENPTHGTGDPPLGWCYLCQKAMYKHNRPYAVLTIFGRVRVCYRCADKRVNAVPATWEDKLIDQRDPAHWSKGEGDAK